MLWVTGLHRNKAIPCQEVVLGCLRWSLAECWDPGLLPWVLLSPYTIYTCIIALSVLVCPTGPPLTTSSELYYGLWLSVMGYWAAQEQGNPLSGGSPRVLRWSLAECWNSGLLPWALLLSSAARCGDIIMLLFHLPYFFDSRSCSCYVCMIIVLVTIVYYYLFCLGVSSPY